MAADAVLHVTDDSFEKDVLKADKPVVVDFWAPWCGPCKTLGPMVEALAVEYQDRVIVSKLNIDDNPMAAGKYGVRSIPTLLLFKNGAVLDTLIGLVPKERLESFLKKGLA